MRGNSEKNGVIAALSGLAAMVLLAAIFGAAFYFVREGQEGEQVFRIEDVTRPSDFEKEPSQTASEESRPQPMGSQAELLLENMSTREKVYQLFTVFPSQVTGVSPVTEAGDLTRQGLAEYPVGGLIYDKTNMVSREQVTEMLATVQTYTKIPLILTCDEEGGRVNRLMSTVGTTYIDSMMSYKDQGPEKAAENARTIAGDMAGCGFNTDLAPVADVWSNPQNTVIGDRAYSDDFAQAAELVAAAVEGFHEGGVACVLKHFPGHGDTAADSHKGAAYVTKTLEELKESELLPFQAGIDAGADMVMIGHVTVSEVEEVPALFSFELVTRLLREEMGFEGVIITDSLQMKAVTRYYDSGQAAVLAVQAGVDMLLCPADLEEAADALMDAVETGVISEERLNQSVLRILKLKEERGILQGEDKMLPTAQIRDKYAAILSEFIYEYGLPDMELLIPIGDEYNILNNQYAIRDIDCDGREELIISYTETGLAGMLEVIYDYDPDTELLKREFTDFPMLSYYDNGIIIAYASHDYSMGMGFVPFTLYEYNEKNDEYERIGYVDTWSKETSDSYKDRPFPDGLDTDHDGVLYNIQQGSNESYEFEDYKYNLEDYEEWYDSHMAGACEIEIEYNTLEHYLKNSIDRPILRRKINGQLSSLFEGKNYG